MPAAQHAELSSNDITGWMFQAYEEAMEQSWVSAVANEYSSDSASETYEGIGNVPAMREWLGGKQAQSFSRQSLVITNKDWESTLAIKVKDMRRDKTGFLRTRISELMMRAVEHQAKLISDLIEAGAGTTVASTYDSKALFSNTHSVGDSGTMDNLIDVDISTIPAAVHGSTTAPSPAEAARATAQAVKTMLGFKDDKGEPINMFNRSFTVMVPVGLSDAFDEAFSSDRLDQNGANPLRSSTRNTYSLVVNPRLTWTTKFAVFANDAPFKTFISQIEDGPTFKTLEGGDHEFKENERLYSVEKSGNVGLGRFDKAVQVTMT